MIPYSPFPIDGRLELEPRLCL